MRAASPPRQMERENEMIVISHRLFVLASSAGDGKRIEACWLKERGRTVFCKIAKKWDLLPLGTVCRKYEEVDSAFSIPNLYPAIKIFYFMFLSKTWQIFLAAAVPWSADRGERNGGIPRKYIDSDIIGAHGILKNALLLLIPIFGYIDTDIKSAGWTIISANKFRTIVRFLLYSCFFSLAKLRETSKITIDAYGSTEWETMDMSPFPWGWAKGG